jgi:hypothetical protein
VVVPTGFDFHEGVYFLKRAFLLLFLLLALTLCVQVVQKNATPLQACEQTVGKENAVRK